MKSKLAIARTVLWSLTLGIIPCASIQAATFNVDIINFLYEPPDLRIQAGDTVTWTQKDFTQHTTTSDNGLWSSPLLSLGQRFSFTFGNPGTFSYFCEPHPFMTGSITVAAAANNPPTISISSPANGTALPAPANVTIQAIAADAGGTITRVEFFSNNNSVGVSLASPYSITISNLTAGAYALTAKATDNQGASTTSAAVNITVQAAANLPPTVSVTSPANGAAFTAPAPIMIQAAAADTDGTLSKVEFFAGATLLNTVLASPFAFTWTNALSGTHTLTAKATDNLGASTTSTPVSIVVNDPAPAPASLKIASIVAEGNSLTIQWTGGIPPYLLQRKVSLTDTTWANVLTVTAQNAIVANDRATAFFRVVGGAASTATSFNVLLNGAAERPNPVITGATGFGTLSLEGSTLTYQISYSGLSGPPSAAHIHGPAPTSVAAGVLQPIGPLGAGTSGTLSGSLTLTADQVTALKSGKVYANIHTAANPAGEIRGQVAPVQLSATLNGANEVPPVTTGATGAGVFTLIGSELSYRVTYSGLSSAATAAHIHGPADLKTAAGVLQPLPGVSGTAGTLTGALILTPAQLASLLDGLIYVNIHTSVNAGGEIRGQIIP